MNIMLALANTQKPAAARRGLADRRSLGMGLDRLGTQFLARGDIQGAAPRLNKYAMARNKRRFTDNRNSIVAASVASPPRSRSS